MPLLWPLARKPFSVSHAFLWTSLAWISSVEAQQSRHLLHHLDDLVPKPCKPQLDLHKCALLHGHQVVLRQHCLLLIVASSGAHALSNQLFNALSEALVSSPS